MATALIRRHVCAYHGNALLVRANSSNAYPSDDTFRDFEQMHAFFLFLNDATLQHTWPDKMQYNAIMTFAMPGGNLPSCSDSLRKLWQAYTCGDTLQCGDHGPYLSKGVGPYAVASLQPEEVDEFLADPEGWKRRNAPDDDDDDAGMGGFAGHIPGTNQGIFRVSPDGIIV